MRFVLSILWVMAFQVGAAQTLTGEELLAKAIQYHDPANTWPSFQGEFKVVLEMQDNSRRASTITIDLPQEYFNVSTEQEGKKSFREIKNGHCRFSEADGTVKEASLQEKHCERTTMFKNYYTYLYGLPMKLKDAGTHINPEVKRVSFKNKDYLVLRVTYDKAVGSDIWQFYFNPTTYAMEVYQFFKGEDEKTGEYILLSGEMLVNGIKMPKDRAWYYNKDDGYLGTDKLMDK